MIYKFINVHPVFPRIIYVIFVSTYCKLNCLLLFCIWGQGVVQMVQTLRYKPQGQGFESLWCT